MKRCYHCFSLLFCLLIVGKCIAGSPVALTTITTLPIGQSTICQGTPINVSFTIDAPADAGNVFTAQLSDLTGSFANPVNIGTLNSTTAGTITATVPIFISDGSGYRIRVAGSLPNVIGSDNGSDIIIDLLPLPSIDTWDGSGIFCEAWGISMNASPSGPGFTCQWQLNGTDIIGATSATYFTTISGNYTVVVTNASGCSGQSPVFTATGIPQGQSEIYVMGGSTALCPGGFITLEGDGLTGTWYLDGNMIPDIFSSVLNVTVPGDYQWQRHPLSGCDELISPPVTITTLTASFTGLASSYPSNAAPVTLVGNPAGGTFSGPGVTGDIFNPAAAGVGGPYTITYTYTDPNIISPCTVVSSQQTTVTQGCIPPPAVITPGGPTTFCQNGSVLLNANTGTGLTYQWFLGSVGITAATSSFLSVGISGDYTVVVTDASGCSATSAPVTITVNPLPVVSFTGLSATYTVIDPPVTLTGSPAGGTFSGPAVTGNIFDPSAAPVGVPDTVRYTYTNANGCTNTTFQITNVTLGCTPPNATISPVGPITICDDDDVLLNANIGTGLTYQWQLDGIAIAGATLSFYVANTDGDYTVVVSNGAGCSATSAPVSVTVVPLPVVSFTGLLGSYSVTASPVMLTGVPAGGSFSGPGISGNTFNPAVAGVGGPYTIVYSYTNINGCSSTSQQQTTVTAIVCNVPAVPGSISTANGGTLVCPGDVKTYSINPVNGALSYTWTAPPGADITGGQGTLTATVTYNAGFTTGDSLRVTANNSCGSSIPRGRKINRKAPPSSPLAITGPVTGICNTAAVPYSVIPEAGMTYTWSWNTGGVSIGSGQGTDAVTSDFTTSFITGKISVTATNSCGTSTPRNLVVDAKPGTPGVITGSTGVCAGQQGVPYSIIPVPNATSYIWYAPTLAHINDGITTSLGSSLATTATNVTVNFAGTAGPVRVKAVNPCVAGTVTSLPVAIICRTALAVTGKATEQSADIYPNPSTGHFRIIVANVQKMATAKIEIMNQFGQIVYQGDQKCNSGMIDIDLTGKFANGIYMVSCVVDGEKMVRKLMISK